MFAAGSFALPRVELRRELRCEVQNYSSVKSSLLVGRSTMPCQQTLLLLAGGLNLGSCPYRILREILRKLAWDLGSCFLLGAYQQDFSLTLAATILRVIISLLRETCANLREHILMILVGAGWDACCFAGWLLLAGGMNLGSCPYRILREILRKLAWDLGCCWGLGGNRSIFGSETRGLETCATKMFFLRETCANLRHECFFAT